MHERNINGLMVEIDYPRTASILDELADSYLQESIYERKRELIDYR